jgi:hypothetical protein
MNRKNSFSSFFIASASALLLFPGAAAAATIETADCSQAAVQTAIDSAADGDTVVIVNGSCSWTGGISTDRQITLQGESVDGVTITHEAGAATLLDVTIGSAFRTTIANLSFMPGSGTGVYVELHGTGLAPLMHDCSFNIPNFQLDRAVKWEVTGGVIWNTTFESTENLSGECGTQVGSDSGSLLVRGGPPWDTDSTLGTLDTTGEMNVYIEDSVFSYVGQAPDVDSDGRVVIRHCRFIGSSGTTHGPTSTTGGRQFEFYDNEFSYPNPNRNLNRYFWFRAGTGVITGNSIQAIDSAPCYANASSFVFAVENAHRNAHGCCTAYMCFHQPGSGSDGVAHSPPYTSAGQDDEYQIPDPVYIWDNTGTGAASDRIVGINDGEPADCGTTYGTSDFFVEGRDYIVDGGPKPGYAPYPYPHPLRGTEPPPDEAAENPADIPPDTAESPAETFPDATTDTAPPDTSLDTAEDDGGDGGGGEGGGCGCSMAS